MAETITLGHGTPDLETAIDNIKQAVENSSRVVNGTAMSLLNVIGLSGEIQLLPPKGNEKRIGIVTDETEIDEQTLKALAKENIVCVRVSSDGMLYDQITPSFRGNQYL